MRADGLDTLIVDDEPLALTRLQALCSRLEGIKRVRTATNGSEALDAIEQDIPDLVLLDVDMPDVSGIDVAEKSHSSGKRCEIVFTTAHSQYAVRAFRLRAADFLLKPVRQSLLEESVDRAREALSIKRQCDEKYDDIYLWVKDPSGSLRISCADIHYILAERDYMRLCLSDRSHLILGSMKSLSETIPDTMFSRIHRSTMVRNDFVRQVGRKGRNFYVVLQDGTELTVGANYIENALKL